MGKASRTKEPDRRARIALQREAARRAEQRKRIYIAGGSILAVIIVVVAFVIIRANTKGSSSAAKPGTGVSGPTGAALASIVKDVTSVPAATLNQVGSGSGVVTGLPLTIKPAQSALKANGKPEMLYMGAEYCPFCAAERWAMAVAVSRFGTLTGVQTTHSAITDGQGDQEVDPNTDTLTFLNANFTSPYLTFEHVELNTNIPDASTGGYTALQTPNTVQNALIDKYDTSTYDPSLTEPGSIPFIDFGNKYMIAGASYNPAVLADKSWAQIAAALSDPSSPIAVAIDGTANYITAAICAITGNQPATACTPVVQSLESKI